MIPRILSGGPAVVVSPRGFEARRRGERERPASRAVDGPVLTPRELDELEAMLDGGASGAGK